jgi:hypothetical protein
VQVAGSAGTLEVNRLRRLADEIEPFRSLLIRHEQVLFAQSQQSAACNASHSIEARNGRLEAVPNGKLAVRWLNHQCRRVPAAIVTSA